MRSKGKIIFLSVILFAIAFAFWVLWSNIAIEVSEYTVTDSEIPVSFSGFRIVQVSDLHNVEFGEKNEELIALIKKAKPDIIVLTGDLADSRRTDIAVALDFVRQAVAIAPTYYITGNHESRISDYGVLKAGLIEAEVVVLENESVDIKRADEAITILGIQDMGFGDDFFFTDYEIFEQYKNTLPKSENYTVMLAHRPHLFGNYAAFGADLVLSGHAHGGQFRLPFVGGVFAPGQGLWPKYDAGLFDKGESKMIVSRGLGKSVIPLRFNNRPELVVVELKSE